MIRPEYSLSCWSSLAGGSFLLAGRRRRGAVAGSILPSRSSSFMHPLRDRLVLIRARAAQRPARSYWPY